MTYPIYYITAEYSDDTALAAWSAEGQNIEIDLSFQYQIDRSNLLSMYAKYEQDYEDVFKQIAQEAIKEVTTDFTTAEFFTERRTIGYRMFKQVQTALESEYALLKHLQLRGITIPVDFDAKVTEKVTVEQSVITAEEQQEADVIRAESDVILSEAYSNGNITEFEAGSEGEILIAEYENLGRETRLQAQALIYGELKETLNFTNDQLLNYIWIRTFQEHAEAGQQVKTAITSPFIELST